MWIWLLVFGLCWQLQGDFEARNMNLIWLFLPILTFLWATAELFWSYVDGCGFDFFLPSLVFVGHCKVMLKL